ncbi:MAG: M20/M25/M40 family metallo-hydrolase [Desulfobacterales bacterium]|nr:MAG: M20/M25/M40 family metallo-hydrolase [Desulfobacterales bacterium]
MREIIELTKELIRFKTMHSKPEEIQRCASHIENYLKNNDIPYRRMDHNQIPSILVMPPNDYASILLMSHIDVVDAPDEMFEPIEKDGKLFGRGSIDDKYAAALSLVLIKNQLQRLKDTNGGQEDLAFGILITGDEEIGGADGVQIALKEIKTDFAIALDGGSIEKIVVKEKGIVQLKLIARGKSAHGARPWLGENAIENLIDDYMILKKYFDLSTPDHWHRTLNFGRIQAGESINQVPDYAEALFDVRYTENDDMEDVVEQIRDKIRGELIVEKKEPLFMGGETPYLDLLLEISPKTAVGFEHGASDARFLSDHGFKGIVWGADGDMSQHSADEHLNIDSVDELYRVLDEFMERSMDLKKV